jgi:hypothetical protein
MQAERGGEGMSKTEAEYLEMVREDFWALGDVPVEQQTMGVCLAAVVGEVERRLKEEEGE